MDMEIDDELTARMNAVDVDSDYEEEEFVVYVDIEPTSISESQLKNANKIKLYGIDKQKPVLQINNQFFEGKLSF